MVYSHRSSSGASINFRMRGMGRRRIMMNFLAEIVRYGEVV
jgi:hypothetical protein